MIYERGKHFICGDRFLLVKYGDENSLKASYKSIGMTDQIAQEGIRGIVEINPGTASVMINYDPRIIRYKELTKRIMECEEEAVGKVYKFSSRVIEVPIWYDDQYTRECSEQFGVRPNLEWAADVNGMSKDDFIKLHSTETYWVTSLGFTPGSPAFFAINPKKDLSAPKYKPRTWTPKGALGMGGNSNMIYSAPAPGGFSMLGISPLVIYDTEQRNPVFKDDIVFFRAGDRIKISAIGQQEFEMINKNCHEYKIKIIEGEQVEITL